MTSTTSGSGYRRVAVNTLYRFSPVALKDLLAVFQETPDGKQGTFSYDHASDIFEVSCPAGGANEVFANFVNVVLQFIQTELSRAEEDERTPLITRIPESCIHEDLLDSELDEEQELFDDVLIDTGSDDRSDTDFPESIGIVHHILKVKKKQDFKLDFCRLDEMPPHEVGSILIAPGSSFFDFGLNQGQLLGQSYVCRYRSFDPSEAKYVVKERVIKPLASPPMTVDLWQDLKFRKVGNVPPMIRVVENSSPVESIEPVAVVQQWLADTSTAVEEEADLSYVVTNAGLQRPHPSEKPPVLSTPSVATPHNTNSPTRISNGPRPTQTTSRNGSAARTVPTSLADTPSPSQPWALKVASSAQDPTVVSGSGWDDKLLPDITSGQQFPSMRQPFPAKENIQGQGRIAQPTRPSQAFGSRKPFTSVGNERISDGRGRGWTGKLGPANNFGRGRGNRGYHSQAFGSQHHGSYSSANPGPRQNLQPPKAQNKFDLLIDLEEQEGSDESKLSEARALSDPPVVDLMDFTTPVHDAQPQHCTESFENQTLDEDESLEVIDRLQPEHEREVIILRSTMRQRKPSPVSSKKKGKATQPTKKVPTAAAALQSLKAWTLDAPLTRTAMVPPATGSGNSSAVKATEELSGHSSLSDCGYHTPVDVPTSVTYDDDEWMNSAKRASNSEKVTDTKDATSSLPEEPSELFLKVKDILLVLFHRIQQESFVEMQLGKIIFKTLPDSLKGRQLDFSQITTALSNVVTSEPSSQPFTNLVSTSAADITHILSFFGVGSSNSKRTTEAFYEICYRGIDGKKVCLILDGMADNAYQSHEIEDSASFREPVKTFATILMHFPQRIWDARLTVTDTKYTKSGNQPDVVAFLETVSVHVPEGKSLPEISGRDGNGLFIESIRLVTRLHVCKAQSSTHLKVDRIFDLPIQRPQTSDSKNSGLFRAAALDEPLMIADHRLWYEVSLGINEALSAVPDHEMESVLARSIGELERETENIVLKMDAIGLNNKGHGHMLGQKILKKMKRKEERNQDDEFW